jgi:hypothetical protein
MLVRGRLVTCDLDAPLGTITATVSKYAVVFVAKPAAAIVAARLAALPCTRRAIAVSPSGP